MASAILPMVQVLRGVAASAGYDSWSDRRLLERYLSNKDEAAFLTLLQRHGQRVLSACQQVLSDREDIEDAFQATFLVLLDKARTVRWQDSFGSWLFMVAHRVAVRARDHGNRRRVHESKLPRREPDPDLSWQEAQQALHEELDSLPDRFRLPLLHCYLEGKSRDEAARDLGLSLGTVKGRLERGRDLLRNRLTRRGITLSAGLLASLAGSEARASLELLGSTLSAVTSLESVPVAGEASRALLLARGVLDTMTTSNRFVVGLLCVLITAGLGVGLWARSALLPPKGSAPHRVKQQEEKPSKPTDRIVKGRVLGPSGKPIQGVKLYVPRAKVPRPRRIEDIEIAQRGVTNAKGEFEFVLPKKELTGALRMPLVAVAKGYGVDWRDLQVQSSGEFTLRLVKDHPIQGRIFDMAGKPVVGLRVTVHSLHTTKDESIDTFLTTWLREGEHAASRMDKRLFLPMKGILESQPTDKEGKFEIHGIGLERVAVLSLGSDTVAHETFFVANRPGLDPKPYNDASLARMLPQMRALGNAPILYKPTIEHVVRPVKLIRGVVRDVATKKPIPKVNVRALTGYDNAVSAITDDRGRFELKGIAKKKQYLLSAMPNARTPFMNGGARVEDTAGLTPIDVEIELARGVVLSGTVTDKATGKPVSGHIRFVPLPQNEFATKPGLDSYKTDRTSRRVDSEGKFEFISIPGPGVLLFQAQPQHVGEGERLGMYRLAEPTPEQAKRLEAKEDGKGSFYFATVGNSIEFLGNLNAFRIISTEATSKKATFDLKVDPGSTLEIEIVDEKGAPVEGATVSGRTASWPMVTKVRSSTCTLYALGPKEKRTVLVSHPKRGLGGVFEVSPGDKPITLKLSAEARASGTLLDEDGEPLVGVRVAASARGHNASELYRTLVNEHAPTVTDSKGRFELQRIVPGEEFYLQLSRNGTYFVGKPRIGRHTLKPGESKDFGKLTLAPRR